LFVFFDLFVQLVEGVKCHLFYFRLFLFLFFLHLLFLRLRPWLRFLHNRRGAMDHNS
jgi:hypothetical protein